MGAGVLEATHAHRSLTSRRSELTNEALPKLHFISGLPRSGSTLLAGILRQNPQLPCRDDAGRSPGW